MDYMQPVSYANPYLNQASQASQNFGNDTFNSWQAMRGAQGSINSFQNQQSQIAGGGGVGYVAGGGNATGTGGYFNPWTSVKANIGQSGDPNLPGYNPTAKPGGHGYAVSGYGPTYSSQYMNTQGLTPQQLSGDPASILKAVNALPQNGSQGAYPTYPNQYGIGSGTGSGASTGGTTLAPNSFGATTAPSTGPSMGGAAASTSTGIPAASAEAKPTDPLANTTQGFNPWSLGGESNSISR